MGEDRIEFIDLSAEDVAFVTEQADRLNVASRVEPADSATFGDVTLVTVSLLAIPSVAAVILAYILRPGQSTKKTFSYKFRSVSADGSWQEHELTITEREQQTKQLSPQTLNTIAQITHLSHAQIEAALRAGTLGAIP